MDDFEPREPTIDDQFEVMNNLERDRQQTRRAWALAWLVSGVGIGVALTLLTCVAFRVLP